MDVTSETVRRERDRLEVRGDHVVATANRVREALGPAFGVDLPAVTVDQYERRLDEVFAGGPRAVNVTALAGLLRDLDVTDDYPGFVVDEPLGRELAALVAGDQPLRLLAEATFHYADVAVADEDGTAGADNLDAALAAGLQTAAPGWPWRETDPFGLDPG